MVAAGWPGSVQRLLLPALMPTGAMEEGAGKRCSECDSSPRLALFRRHLPPNSAIPWPFIPAVSASPSTLSGIVALEKVSLGKVD